MFYQPILLPLLAQVGLTFLVWIYLYVTRLGEINTKKIKVQKLSTAASSQALLTDSAGPSENFKNLFEMPVLFYAAILLSLVLLVQDRLLAQLAWTFVALRAFHSLVHCTYNRVMHRFVLYLASSLVLILMWFRLGLYVFTQ